MGFLKWVLNEILIEAKTDSDGWFGAVILPVFAATAIGGGPVAAVVSICLWYIPVPEPWLTLLTLSTLFVVGPGIFIGYHFYLYKKCSSPDSLLDAIRY